MQDPRGKICRASAKETVRETTGRVQIPRFQSLERSLHQKQRFHDVEQVIQEYMDLKHAKPVPAQDLGKEVFYMWYTKKLAPPPK